MEIMKLPLRSLLCLAIMAVSAGQAGAAGIGNVPAQALNETLKVEVRQGKVLLHLTLHNRSDSMIRVAREFATEKELERGVFEVQDANSGEAIAYTGMMVKRGALTLRDFVAIRPHAKKSNTIVISKSYVFKAGHSYSVRHVPSYLGPAGNLEQPLTMDAVSVTFKR